MMMLPFPARLRVTLFTLTLTLLSGCALIQDEPSQVAIVNPQQAQLAQVIHLANSDWPAARWWEAYDDPQLNLLINRALQNSPTMQAARLRISQSQSTVELARSAMGLGSGCLWQVLYFISCCAFWLGSGVAGNNQNQIDEVDHWRKE